MVMNPRAFLSSAGAAFCVVCAACTRAATSSQRALCSRKGILVVIASKGILY